MHLSFAQVDTDKLAKFIKKWPYGGTKDGFGLPKLMLPVSIELMKGTGVKLVFKGTADPWVLVDFEGNTVSVYRQSSTASLALQISALKQREESKICEKLKADMKAVDCGASGMTEKSLEPPKQEAPRAAAEEPKDTPKDEAPTS